MTRTSLAVAAVTVALTAAAHADTPPSAWDRAKDPAAGDRWELHTDVRQAMSLDVELGIPRVGLLDRARAELEDAGAATSPDVRLRFDLGEIYETQKDHERAIRVLEPALALAPDHPAAKEAWAELAYAYAYRDMTKKEIGAYDRYLALETDAAPRVTALLNLAEAHMRIAELDEAVAGYRETIALASALPFREGADDEVLATWGLAVALDRSGDPTGGAEAGRQATQIDAGYRLITDIRRVFFVPAYERYWYLALGHTEDAKHAPNARKALAEWRGVVDLWSRYVNEAAPNDRWLPLARLHLVHALSERARVEKRARAEHAPSPPPGDEEILIQ